MKLVLDTCVLIDHLQAADPHCSAALNTARQNEHKLVVCQRLLQEYRHVLGRGSDHLFGMVDAFLMNLLPIEMWEMYDDPDVSIDFGPEEDRFHMQLAIDARSKYHVTKDKAILEEVGNMRQRGVKECTPAEYSIDVELKRRIRGTRLKTKSTPPRSESPKSTK